MVSVLVSRPRATSQHRRKRLEREGALRHATARLADAIDALVGARYQTIQLENGKIQRIRISSRYHELVDAISAPRAGAGGQWDDQFPFFVDAHMLAAEIDNVIVGMHPHPHCWHGWTIARLEALEQRKWRPQDSKLINDYANTLQAYAKRIDVLFAPRPKYLPDACPACGVKTVYRDRDDAEIRQPALVIVVDQGCVCQSCGTVWGPERLTMLGRVLGYSNYTGVVNTENML